MIFDDKKFLCKGIILVIVAGIAMRMVLGYLLEYNNDILAWALTMGNVQGGGGLYDMAGYFYPPVWGYILAVFGEFLGAIGVDTWGELFTELLYTEDMTDMASVTTPAYNMALTFMYLISDLLGAIAVYWLIKRITDDRIKAKIGFAIYFLVLHLAMVGAVWGQFDTFSALMAILCICLLIKGNDFLAGMLFSAAVLLKLFPAMLIFVIIIYLYRKGGDMWLRRLGSTAAGAAAMALVIIMPIVLEGNLMDSMTFITARAEGGSGSLIDLMLQYSMLIIYPIILVLELILAWFYLKRYDGDEDRGLVWFSFVAVGILFLYPSTPQYVLLLLPFAIVAGITHENRIIRPLLVSSIGTIMMMLTALGMTTVTDVFYLDLFSFDAWVELYDLTQSPYILGYSFGRVMTVAGSFVQTMGTIWVLFVALDSMGTLDWMRERRNAKVQARSHGNTC